jgi:uncharacterized protein Yka (UPF0111/DUF47 family)
MVSVNMRDMSSTYLQAMYDNEHMLATHLTQLEVIEHANDEVTHNLFIELGKNFITPFDREDIHDLTSSLDDVIDYMYSVVRQMKTFAIGKPDKVMQQIAEQQANIVRMLSQAVEGLKNSRQLEAIATISTGAKKLLYVCDSQVDAAISALFLDGVDEIMLIKKMEVFDGMHALVDRCGRVINVLESVVVKYS